MNPPSSSTSSSSGEHRRAVRGALATLAWVAGWLIALDVAINILFAYPRDPKVTNPSQLQLYFDFGNSIEAKLRRQTRADPAATAPITLSGWYEPITAVGRPKPGAGSIVTIYGMSHAVRLADALDRTSNAYQVRSVAAPGATANWAYGAYLRDRGGHKSRAVVLSMMSMTVPMITTMAAMTWNVSFPMPYTEDRFYERNGRLSVIHPPYMSFRDYVDTLRSPARWAAALETFRAHDPMYDPFLMRASLLDHSALFRLIRRAYGQRLERNLTRGVTDAKGFNPDSEQVRVANAIVRDFAAQARKDGDIPIIFIVNNLGYSDSLYRALRQTLEENHIPYLSSHTIVSPNDPRGYLPDTHFTDANDDKLARALAQVIETAEQPQPAAPAGR